jgi:hypothetical protein
MSSPHSKRRRDRFPSLLVGDPLQLLHAALPTICLREEPAPFLIYEPAHFFPAPKLLRRAAKIELGQQEVGLLNEAEIAVPRLARLVRKMIAASQNGISPPVELPEAPG